MSKLSILTILNFIKKIKVNYILYRWVITLISIETFYHHWYLSSNRVLFLDAISKLSQGKLVLTLERQIQIDIDDIFVGTPGIRMIPEDVDVSMLFFIILIY